MTNLPRWSEVRADIVTAAGGEEAVAEAHTCNQSYIGANRLAERRKAPDGQIQISAVFGDDQ
ncbi:Uncharacterised protein [Mycobacterium tuberculosis]|nr:Uncharacterised protein [Mycobacterium tuberculosis]